MKDYKINRDLNINPEEVSEEEMKQYEEQLLDEGNHPHNYELGDMNKYDKEKYKKDFPKQGTLNWKLVKIVTPNNPNLNGWKVNGVLLHDGNFMVSGRLFLKHQFVIVDENPLK